MRDAFYLPQSDDDDEDDDGSPPLSVVNTIVIYLYDWGLIRDIADGAPGAAEDLARMLDTIDNAPVGVEIAQDVYDLLCEAERCVRDGCNADAAHRLHLIARPKWPNIATCRAQYDGAMGVVYGPHAPPPPTTTSIRYSGKPP